MPASICHDAAVAAAESVEARAEHGPLRAATYTAAVARAELCATRLVAKGAGHRALGRRAGTSLAPLSNEPGLACAPAGLALAVAAAAIRAMRPPLVAGQASPAARTHARAVCARLKRGQALAVAAAVVRTLGVVARGSLPAAHALTMPLDAHTAAAAVVGAGLDDFTAHATEALLADASTHHRLARVDEARAASRAAQGAARGQGDRLAARPTPRVLQLRAAAAASGAAGPTVLAHAMAAAVARAVGRLEDELTRLPSVPVEAVARAVERARAASRAPRRAGRCQDETLTTRSTEAGGAQAHVTHAHAVRGARARTGVRARYGAVGRSLKALVAGAAAIVLAAASAGARIRAVRRGGSIAGAASERRHADTGAVGRAGAVPRARHRTEVVLGEIARWPTKATIADTPSVVAEATHACRRAPAGCSGATGDEESYHRAPLSNRWAA